MPINANALIFYEGFPFKKARMNLKAVHEIQNKEL